MAKGKYAARAANRLVQTDNELLIEKSAECDQLRAHVARLKHELDNARKALSSDTATRAEKLAADRVSSVRSDAERRIADAEQKWFRDGRTVADKLWDYFASLGGDGCIPRFFVTDLVPLLIPADEVNDFINSRLDKGIPGRQANREARRHAIRNISRNSRADDNDVHSGIPGKVTATALGLPVTGDGDE